MAATSIEWTDKVWNPVRGCSLVSHGCTNCYAMKQAHRFSGAGQPYAGLTKMTSHGPVWTGEVRTAREMLHAPLRWRKPSRIFVNSMSDLFHENVPDMFICAVFAVMETAQRHTFQILTKRPERMRRLLSAPNFYAGYMRRAGYDIVGPQHYNPCNPGWPLPNVWLGVSCEDQATADARIPLLLQTPATVRWISAEPLLGPIQLGAAIIDNSPNPTLDWVVAGGESGPRARPMHPHWARSLRDQCNAAGVPFLFKQWGEHAPNDRTFTEIEQSGRPGVAVPIGDPDTFPMAIMDRVGKRSAGRELDGRTWDEYPEACV